MSRTGKKWRAIAASTIVLFFVLSLFWQTRASADQSLAEQLLEIMRANHQISEAQYNKLKRKAQEQKAAQAKTNEEYKQLKQQVEQQKAAVQNQQVQTVAQYQQLKKKSDEQQAAISKACALASSQNNVSANEQLRQTGTGTGGGGVNFKMGKLNVNLGGFIEAAGIYRSKWLGADVDAPFQNLPLGYKPSAYQDESRLTGRQSRLSVLVQGDVSPTVHLGGYYEMDFLGSAPSANSNESNSYNPRARHLFAMADWDTYGLHMLGGQTWSLITMNSKGIEPFTVDNPLTIDAQYVPGFNWARQPQFRIVKDWDKTYWLAVSVENPTTTIGGIGPGITNYAINQAPQSGLFASNLSVNDMPDIVEKAAWDAPFGHLEVFNLTRQFQSNLIVGSGAATTLNDQSPIGDAVGGAAIIPIGFVEGLHAEVSAMYGQGIGRYGSGQLPDTTYDSTGAIHPITALHFLGNLTWSPNKEWTFYAYYGLEQAQRSYSGSTYGYGNPNIDVFVAGLDPSYKFEGAVQSVAQITVGDWWNFYHGSFGNMVWGLQYSYTTDTYFSGSNGAGSALAGPQANDNMFYTSLRYYWN